MQMLRRWRGIDWVALILLKKLTVFYSEFPIFPASAPSNFKIVWIASVWPEYCSSAAGLRTATLLRYFRAQGFQIHYFCTSRENEYARELSAAGINVAVIAPNDPVFDELIKRVMPEIVIMDRFMIEEQFSWRVREHAPGSLRVLDTIDLHFLRNARQRAFQEGTPLNLQTNECARELAAIFRSDITLVLSDYERDLLVEDFQVPASLLHLNSLSYAVTPNSVTTFENKNHFVSIGSFRHPPNVDSVHFLKREIWPLIRAQLPKAELHIYGSYPSKQMTDLTDLKTGFLVRGQTHNAVATLEQYRVLLAPLRFGAGVKGKIADMWASGGCVVTTGIGAEGMRYNRQFGGEVAEYPLDFAASAMQLFTKSLKWREKTNIGRETLIEKFDSIKQPAELMGRLLEARSSLATSRSTNSIGHILWHQSLRSTEYFSRWIEAKNKMASQLQL